MMFSFLVCQLKLDMHALGLPFYFNRRVVNKYIRSKSMIIKLLCPLMCLTHLESMLSCSFLRDVVYYVLVFSVMGDCKADIVFIMDSSGSIGSMNWFHIKQTVMDMVQGLKVGCH